MSKITFKRCGDHFNLKQNITISKRLNKIFEMISDIDASNDSELDVISDASNDSELDVISDVGTDHAFLPIAIILNHKAKKVIAMDLREGPLKKAKENIRKYGLSDKIELRLSNGLCNIKEDDSVDAVTISGMGGNTIKDILLSSFSIVRNLKYLILQPQSDIPMIRKFLRENGFLFLDEDIVLEDNKYYFFMKVRYEEVINRINKLKNPVKNSNKEEFKDFLGPILLKKKSDIFKSYLEKELNITEKILKNIEEKDKIKTSSDKRKKELLKKKYFLNKALKLF